MTVKVDNGQTKEEIIQIYAAENKDYPVEIRDLVKGKHRFKIEVNEGTFDFEFILYEK